MLESTITEFANDHKHWLQELDRWEGVLEVWKAQRQSAADEIDALIRRHRELLQDHELAVGSLRHEIAECERRMMANSPDDAVAGGHRKSAAAHEQERSAHERLKRSQHLLLAALATLKHGPAHLE